MTPKKIYYENAAKTIIKNLEKRQMEGFYCPDKESALEKIKELVTEGSSVSYGGSMTMNEAGIMDMLKAGNYNLIVRENFSNQEEFEAVNKEILFCDYFFMSSNAITLDGELINIDGRGNRVAYLCFGPKNVIVVAGMNKIVSDVALGIKRVHDIATPQNTVRLNKNTPCAATGRCGDCLSPDCICSQTVVTRFSLLPKRIKVVLIGEELGY